MNTDTQIDDVAEVETPVTATFVSTDNELRLRRKPTRRKQIGETGDFEVIPGEGVQFRDGRLTSTDAAEIEWLRGHEQNGGFFHELGYGAEGRPADDETAVVKEIIRLAFAGQYDEIADLLLKERQTYSRPAVLASAETALEEGQRTVPELEPQPEHQQERVRTGPAVGPAV